MKNNLKSTISISLLVLPLSANALLSTCTVAATATSFSNYFATLATNNDGIGDVAITCTAQVAAGIGSYTIGLSTGSGTYINRTLISGTNFLNYNLYSDPTRLIVWGDGSAGTQTVTDSYLILLTPTTHHYTVYGRIPPGQSKPASTYTDTVAVTVTY
ncbi:spore coat U domain-containing protein [Glaciimonas sp. CA11.2]|uniref:Csu type fimbrial protein n=1 Tax=unclassified Glaciimonas TaxID=2644401 RepID=UPI002AB38532|nr:MULTISPECIES: spore coat U domain-containing protein [unclassified Glaciimonas]MDY7546689.1 spore coat U domain-containing protein [Glaciimonas sp. CA11.2]MEB0011813.1 spore coat U domain-containing protein [Glaciimonas sp. Cout2]MEB0080631.1 spore coat U domain-containing protein [Glaciimonas sp. Gout2]MEB0162269.1 spore coat U domain-containing protein [Glaciimonas sp. CA11.2]